MAANQRLHDLLAEAGLSHAALARRVVALGEQEGVHLGTTRTSIHRLLAGAQPREPVPRLVATAVGAVLGRLVSITDCGLREAVPAAGAYDALRPCRTLERTVHTVLDLSGGDMRRRDFLRGSAFAATAFSEPAVLALTTSTVDAPPMRPATSADGRVEPADVEVLGSELAHLRRMDQQYGAGRVHARVAAFVHDNIGLATGGRDREVARRACQVLAQATALAGWTAADTGRHALSQRYFVQALDLARHGGDTVYAANLLAHMARLTITLGERLPAEHGARYGRHCVGLARIGQATAEGHATPGLLALLHVTAARGHALLGDRAEADRDLRAARDAFERVEFTAEPDWLVYRTPGEFEVDRARVLRDTGRPTLAEPVFHTALAACPPWQTRRRGMAHLDLALNALATGDLDHTTHAADQALTSPQVLASTKGRERLALLHGRLRTQTPRGVTARDLEHRLSPFSQVTPTAL